MNAAQLEQANALQKKIDDLKQVIDDVEDPETLLLYEPKERHREDASDFPADVVPALRTAAVKALRDRLSILEREFEEL